MENGKHAKVSAIDPEVQNLNTRLLNSCLVWARVAEACLDIQRSRSPRWRSIRSALYLEKSSKCNEVFCFLRLYNAAKQKQNLKSTYRLKGITTMT